ncbi:hypothetical protein CsSME_00015905 [Camellia sinensis var. sinensis]
MRALFYLHRIGWTDDVDPMWHGRRGIQPAPRGSDVASVGNESTNRSNGYVSNLERIDHSLTRLEAQNFYST